MTENVSKMQRYNEVRKQQISVNKEEVINSALSLFLQSDINTVSMNDIAKNAGISRATMYRYFKDKEEIIFIIASKMMEQIFEIAFRDVSFETSAKITEGYKNMVTRFDELSPAYQYMAMFDAIYTKAHPSKDLTEIYSGQFQRLIEHGKDNLTQPEAIRHIMMLNLTMDLLEDLAIHRELIPITQGIPIEVLLEDFEKTIDSIMKI